MSTPWSRVLLEKLTGSTSSQEIPCIFGTRKFITILTSARHLSLSWANFIQSPLPAPTFWRSILILSSHLRLGLPSGLFPSGFPTRTLYTPPPCPIRVTCPAHIILLDFTTHTIYVHVPHFHKPQNYSPICTRNKLKNEGYAISGMWCCIIGQEVPDIFFKDYDQSMITPEKGSCYNPAKCQEPLSQQKTPIIIATALWTSNLATLKTNSSTCFNQVMCAAMNQQQTN